MNTATRVFSSSAVRIPALPRVERYQWSWGVKVMIVLLIISAFGVVYLKDLNRRMFIQYQDMARMNNQAQIEWGKLLLEKSTWAAQASVQQQAVNRLHMVTPTSNQVVLLANG